MRVSLGLTSVTDRPRVIIADDHQIVRDGLKAALETPGLVTPEGCHVVAECGNGMEVIVAAKANDPDLAIIDVQMPLVNGVEAIIEIKRWSPACKLIALTGVTAPGLLRQLVDAEVDGLFPKQGDIIALYEKIPDILGGGRYVDPALDALLEKAPDGDRGLTARERQTLNMIVRGLNNAEIATALGISPKTAEKHRSSLMVKLEVNSVAQLLALALKDGLIDPTPEL